MTREGLWAGTRGRVRAASGPMLPKCLVWRELLRRGTILALPGLPMQALSKPLCREGLTAGFLGGERRGASARWCCNGELIK